MELGNEINYSTITDQERAQHDKALLVTFEFWPVEYQDGGERKFKDVEYIRIRPPGSAGARSEIHRPVTDEDRIRFQPRYEAWKNGEAEPLDGTPLKEWPEMSPANLSACRSLEIKTIEQLAEVSDTALQRMHLVGLKYRARDWLQARKDNSYVNELRDIIENQKKQIAGLEERLERLQSEDIKPTGQQRKRRGRPRKTKQPDG